MPEGKRPMPEQQSNPAKRRKLFGGALPPLEQDQSTVPTLIRECVLTIEKRSDIISDSSPVSSHQSYM
jgi:hypothetical protein